VSIRGCNSSGEKATSKLDESGGALIEFTLMAPVFFLIVFAIIEWGSVFFLQSNMVNAAREAARIWALDNGTPAMTSTDAQNVAVNYLAGSGQTYTYVLTDHCTLAPPNKAQDITVQISVDAASAALVNFMGLMGGQLTSKVTMRKERACP
jgi:Flp pilus assembly protein TadG